MQSVLEEKDHEMAQLKEEQKLIEEKAKEELAEMQSGLTEKEDEIKQLKEEHKRQLDK